MLAGWPLMTRGTFSGLQKWICQLTR
jgi:hypothetical protein